MNIPIPAHDRQAWPLLGQETLGSVLLTLLHAGQMPPVVLFVGPAHLGKASGAQWFAQADVCRSDRAAHPCGVCPDCRAVTEHRHPAVVEITSDEARWGIDLVRQALQRWDVAVGHAERRWLLVPDVERLTEAASTALLKFLEDLPTQTIVLMTTSLPTRVVPTIRSRSAQYIWRLVPRASIEAWLETRFPDLGPTDRAAIAARSAGRPGLARMMIDQRLVEAESLGAIWSTFDHRGTQRAPVPDDVPTAIQLLALGIREVILAGLGSDRRLWPKLRDRATEIAQRRSPREWLGTLERAMAANELLERNVQPKMLWYDLLV